MFFLDSGLTTAQVSTLFALWSTTALLTEVPSGALADRVSRRLLLTIAALVKASGFALWLLWPHFTGFALGFLLWGLAGSLNSGTREALLYDVLHRMNATEHYLPISARASTVHLLTMVTATAAATPLFALGGYALAGWLSVAACVVEALVYRSMPDSVAPPGSGTIRQAVLEYLGTLRQGVGQLHRIPAVRRGVLTMVLVSGLTAIDEYLPILAADQGVPRSWVPVWFTVPLLAMAIGSWFAERATSGRLIWHNIVGAIALVTGALSGSALGVVGIAIAFGLWQYADLVFTARLQERIEPGQRATVLSTAGLGVELLAMGIYTGFGAAAGLLPMAQLIALSALPALLVVPVLLRPVPADASTPRHPN
ncbi:MFS transporter [Pseudonocardiaceae bacterium YIM PH 21723]|nr:MFS transporter [Pseudonocardiaceae bacterium YIM PH 21723]